STTLADRLPGRRFSLLVVSQVLVRICHVERSRDISRCFSIALIKTSGLVDYARNDNLAAFICVLRGLNWLPCSSSDNRIQNQQAADYFAEKFPVVGAGNVV